MYRINHIIITITKTFFIIRVEKQILEQIEGLEDKVASASMQVPVSVTD